MNDSSAQKSSRSLVIPLLCILLLVIVVTLIVFFSPKFMNLKSQQSSESTTNVAVVKKPTTTCEIYNLNDPKLDKGVFKGSDKSYLKLSTKLYPELYIFKTETLKIIRADKYCSIGTISEIDNLDIGHSVAIINPSTKAYFGGIEFKETTVSMTHVRWNENIVLYVF
ncbi:MAG TPA: hypothetical protein VLI92_04505 [Candidatus Saccharimonadales bacterium]|nr:hypothetical protein [Candidatus Saccharimonadales bacterium]